MRMVYIVLFEILYRVTMVLNSIKKKINGIFGGSLIPLFLRILIIIVTSNTN